MNLVYIAIFAAVSFALVVIYQATIVPVRQETVLSGPFSLSSSISAVSTSDFGTVAGSTAFLTDGQGTFQCFVYLDHNLKTGGHVDCGTSQNKPSCETGLYNDCECTTSADCTNCAHTGYNQLINLYGVYRLEIMNAPDASRPNSVAVQLSVRTKYLNESSVPGSHIQTIPLPSLAQQKWTMITISRDGRRIDVYYNSNLVSSSTTNNMIVTTNVNGTPVMLGDFGISGQVGGISFFPARLSIRDVSAQYAKTTDTRGNPTMFKTTQTEGSYSIIPDLSTSSVINTLCLDGSCMPTLQVGEPNLSSYSNIFNINPQANVAVTTQYA